MGYIFPVICAITLVLIIIHGVISRRKGTSEHQGGRPGHWTYSTTVFISFLLLLIYIAGAGGAIYSGTFWPNVGSKDSIFLFLLCPGVLFQLFFVTYSLIKRKLPVKRIWARLLSIIVGFFLAGQLMNISSAIAMQRFEQASRPLVEMIKENLPRPCNPETPYAKLVPLEWKDNKWHPGNRWQLWYDEDSFILTFSGGSVDIDGSTIYYFSKQGTWTIFHNDSKEDSRKLQGLLESMEDCGERRGS